ncbi:MAG: MBL fold metallo-hydrolase [Oscillospiraceae bacterium]|nr:MBL fold metallo-hydrolase [Oscillospiraceae bacterium]
MTITWLGHACFVLESGGYRVVLDPFKGVPGCKDIATEADAVYCSHNHFDHCFTRWIQLTEGKESPFTVREIASFHDEQSGAQRGENTIRTLTAEGITVVHLGDLGHQLSEQQVAEIGACDVLLLPVGGTYTVDPVGAKMVADAIQPRVVCPMHYRRGEMGFEVLATAEDFAAQYPPERVHWLNTNHVSVTEELLEQGGVVFFQI